MRTVMMVAVLNTAWLACGEDIGAPRTHDESPEPTLGQNHAIRLDAGITLVRPALVRYHMARKLDDLRAIEQRRTLPVRFTQWLQLTIQKRIISRVLETQQRPKPPLFFKLFNVLPVLRRIPARVLGVGIRPEHVRTPEAPA